MRCILGWQRGILSQSFFILRRTPKGICKSKESLLISFLPGRVRVSSAPRSSCFPCSSLKPLTGRSFIVHVRLAAGRECAEEQFPLIISPILYPDWIPVIDGRSSGVSAGRNGKFPPVRTNVSVNAPRWSFFPVLWRTEWIIKGT